MHEIVVTVETQHHPEDVAFARQCILEVARCSRLEPGCLSYTVAADLVEPTVTRVSEIWRSRGEHEHHMNLTHVQHFFDQVRDLRVIRRQLDMFETARRIDLTLPGD